MDVLVSVLASVLVDVLVDVLMDVLCLESRSILAPVGLGLLLVLLLSLNGQLTFTLLFSSHLKVVADKCFS